MKHIFTFTLFLACGFGLLAQGGPKGYEIKIKVKGFQQKEAYLAYYFGDKQYIKDTAQVTNGEFVFSDPETRLPGGIYLVVLPPKNNYFELMVDADQHFSFSTDTTDLAQKAVVTGCKENEVFYEDVRFLASQRKIADDLNAKIKATADTALQAQYKKELQAVDEKVKARRKQIMTEHPDLFYSKVLEALKEPEIPEAPLTAEGKPDQNFQFQYYRSHFFDYFDLGDPRLLRTPMYNQKVTTYLDRLTVKQPDSISKAADYLIGMGKDNSETFQYLVVSILNKYAESKVMGMDGVYVHMVEKYYMTGLATWTDPENLQKMVDRAQKLSPTLVGRPAKDFYAFNTQGGVTRMSEQKADWLIVYFWDYDCSHCKKVTPALAEAIKEFATYPNVKLMTISINGDVNVWKTKLKEYGLDGLANTVNTQDHTRIGGFQGNYDILSTPRIFVLDKEKKVYAKQIDVATLKKILNHELGIKTFEESEAEEAANSNGEEAEHDHE